MLATMTLEKAAEKHQLAAAVPGAAAHFVLPRVQASTRLGYQFPTN
jgi:hypothetical protein